MAAVSPLPPLPLPAGVRARQLPTANGLVVHLLEAGFDDPGRPLLLLLHGFPELAYSWRRVMPALAAAGYHVVAPDQRGYGRTTGWKADYDDAADLDAVHLFNLVRDQLALLHALGRPHVHAVVGHDFGSPVAAWCALVRPDVFRAVVLMSAPFAGPPSWQVRIAGPEVLDAELAALPQPRRHYQHHYATRGAEAEMLRAPQGLHAFPTPAQVAACRWLPDDELAVYAAEFARTGLQGGLQWYRSALDLRHRAQLRLFAGRRIEVPGCFIAGRQDWGVHQVPGACEAMATQAFADFRGSQLIDGAGHWVQQEQADAVSASLLDFLAALPRA